MIEVVAKLGRGPVFLAGEVLECVVSFSNPLSALSTSASSETLAWASAQIHCQFHASESRVHLPANEEPRQDVQAENETVFVPNRGERGQCILSTPPKILFCDLRLDPGESKSYSYSESLPLAAPPSFRGQSVKYVYKLTIGCQRVNCPIQLLRVPFRVLLLHALQNFQPPQEDEVAPSNPFLDEEGGGKKDSRLLDSAVEILMALTSRRTLHQFNISNSRGRVGTFCIFKTVYKIGEDVIGTFSFSDGEIPCLQVSEGLGTGCARYKLWHCPREQGSAHPMYLMGGVCFSAHSTRCCCRRRRVCRRSTGDRGHSRCPSLPTPSTTSPVCTRPAPTSASPSPSRRAPASAPTSSH
ncbi:hypothetical protein XENTR_v10003290 [Xenopus tropicalis]|nr:hypothetical protein XENTR_v10003290 [Xenopus tropicalis]